MSSYSVRRGDTLSAIAARFHTSVSKLASANHIHNVNLIHTGQRLQVPGHDGVDHFDHGSHARPQPQHHAPSHSTQGASGTQGGIHVSNTMRRLASAGHNAAMSMGGYRGLGLCATGVSRAIHSAMGLSVHGNGNQIDNNLPRSHFRQLHIPLSQALKIPGLVLTWEHTSTRLGRIYGHTAITTGITMRTSARKLLRPATQRLIRCG